MDPSPTPPPPPLSAPSSSSHLPPPPPLSRNVGVRRETVTIDPLASLYSATDNMQISQPPPTSKANTNPAVRSSDPPHTQPAHHPSYQQNIPSKPIRPISSSTPLSLPVATSQMQLSKSALPPPLPSAITTTAAAASSSCQQVNAPILNSNTSTEQQDALSNALKTQGQLISLFLSKCRVSPLDIKSVPRNSYAGLVSMARFSAWNTVVEATSTIIRPNDDDIHLTPSLKLRFQGLYKTKQFDTLIQEANRLLFIEENRLTVTEDGVAVLIGDIDAIIALKIILADVKALTGLGEEALQLLFTLKLWLEGKDNTASGIASGTSSSSSSSSGSSCSSSGSSKCSTEWWLWRLRNVILNTEIRLRLWRAAINELVSMIDDTRKKCQDYMQTMNTTIPPISLIAGEIILHTRMSRLLVNIGIVDASVQYCKNASDIFSKYKNDIEKHDTSVYRSVSSNVSLSLGLVAFTENKFVEASKYFADVIQIERTNGSSSNGNNSANSSINCSGSSSSSSCSDNDPYGCCVNLEESVLSVAVNNYAICSLHLCKANEAIVKLEELILEDPVRHICDPIVFNLCTLYDLSCSPDVSAMKKRVLENVALAYHIDDPVLNWRSFRLT